MAVFIALWRVMRTVGTKSKSISLIRKVAVSKMTIGILSKLESEVEFVIPDLVWKLEGPAVQVLTVII